MKQLSEILSGLMTKWGIKSAELAREIGIGQPVIHRLMSGVTDNPQVYTLEPIAKYFGITIEQLIGKASLKRSKLLHSDELHQINNQLAAIKTIASVLEDVMPNLTEGYLKATESKLMPPTISKDMLPLLSMNVSNLMNTVIALQTMLSNDRNQRD